MFKKKCKFINDEFNAYIKDEGNEYITYMVEHLEYIAHFDFPSVGTLRLSADVSLAPASEHTTIYLFLECPNSPKPVEVIVSEIDKTERDLQLKEIVVPEGLRHKGLGSYIFKSWLKIAREFSLKHGWTVSRIYGDIGNGAHYRPKYSKKLYRKMHNYKYDEEKYLCLNKKEFKHNHLEYTFTSTKSFYLF